MIGNTYDLSGECGIGFLHRSGKPFLFDKEDYEKIKDITWVEGRGGYASGYSAGRWPYMHRLILPCEGMLIDHINRNRLDNRKRNLRIASIEENARNRSRSKNNTSGCTGVFFETGRKRWKAQIWVDGRSINLGRYRDKLEAEKARKDAERQYFGEFAPYED